VIAENDLETGAGGVRRSGGGGRRQSQGGPRRKRSQPGGVTAASLGYRSNTRLQPEQGAIDLFTLEGQGIVGAKEKRERTNGRKTQKKHWVSQCPWRGRGWA